MDGVYHAICSSLSVDFDKILQLLESIHYSLGLIWEIKVIPLDFEIYIAFVSHLGRSMPKLMDS
jgi:hypothetical protein